MCWAGSGLVIYGDGGCGSVLLLLLSPCWLMDRRPPFLKLLEVCVKVVPYPPFLFTIVAKALSALLMKAKVIGLIEGFAAS